MARGGRRRKRRTHVQGEGEAGRSLDSATAPKSFVLSMGSTGRKVHNLVRDLRRVMEPFTAVRLQERRSNKLKDFVDMAGPLGVTHLLLFTQTEKHLNMRIARTPRGPTLHFRVTKYALHADIVKTQARPKAPGTEYLTPPLVVLNNFSSEENHFKMMSIMFQNMFPPINVETMKLTEARRVVLFNYNAETKRVDVRHYLITVAPVGLSKSIKKIVQNKLPDDMGDISEFVLKEAQASESDMEDGPDTQVTLPQKYLGRNNRSKEQRAIKLVEIGPRLELQLVKIQKGLCDGDVLHHEFVKKTPEEIKKQAAERQRKLQEKAQRRKQQEENVKRKQAAKDEEREKQRKRLKKDGDEEGEGESDDEMDQDEEREEEEEEEDAVDQDQDIQDDDEMEEDD